MADKPQTRSQYRKTTKKQPATAKKAQSKKRNIPLLIFKIIFFAALFCAFSGITVGAAVFYHYAKEAPKLVDSKLRDPLSSKILDKDGKVFAEVGTEQREYIEYKAIPQKLKDAILSTEDSRFYQHDGIDPIRFGGAVVANIKDGFGAEGASTLSQQIIKMSYLDYTNKTLARKSQEAWLALQLEEKYSKNDILEIYVNKVYMSDRVHGMQTAAEHYYGKKLDKLTLPETALIGGMPQSPNSYNPYEHPKAAKERRNTVLHNMYKHNKISKEDMDKAIATPIKKGLVSLAKRNDKTYKYDAYVTQVLNEIPKKYDVYRDGLTIHTSLDQDAQKYTEKMMNTNEIVNYSDKDMQAGIVMTDTKNGRIYAIGGARNQKVQRGYNYATQLKRSVGSTMKPIADYGPAFEYLNWSTAHVLDDSKYTYSNGVPINDFDFGFKGKMSLRAALYQSRNIPALKTLQAVGLENSQSFASKLGMDYPLKDYVESFAIGANEASPLQLAGAYAAFGNDGNYTKPHAVEKIVLSDGKTSIDMEPKSSRAMKESTAYMVTDVLKDVLKVGTGTTAAVPGVPVAGKTGTTNFSAEQAAKHYYPSGAARDAWFAGYSTNYSIAVWTGYNNDKKSEAKYLSPDEQRISQRMFSALMGHVSANRQTSDFQMPSNVVRIPVIKGSDPVVRAASGTPSDQVSYELFLSGHLPAKTASAPKKDKDADKKDDKDKDKKEDDQDKDKDKKEDTEKDKLDAPSNLSAKYDQSRKIIRVSWNGVSGASSYVVTVNGSASTVSSTAIEVSGGKAGSTVSISVVAKKDGQTSGSASTSVAIPKEETNNDPADNNKDNDKDKDNDKNKDANKDKKDKKDNDKKD